VVETWEDDPERLDQVRERRQALRELGRKYGPTLEDVLATADSARVRLAELAGLEERAAELDREVGGPVPGGRGRGGGGP